MLMKAVMVMESEIVVMQTLRMENGYGFWGFHGVIFELKNLGHSIAKSMMCFILYVTLKMNY